MQTTLYTWLFQYIMKNMLQAEFLLANLCKERLKKRKAILHVYMQVQWPLFWITQGQIPRLVLINETKANSTWSIPKQIKGHHFLLSL